MKEVPFTTDAEDVAATVVKHLRRGAIVIWSPAVLKYIMTVLRHLPPRIFFTLTGKK
jgi:decaprenylphospho-beta-D-erythro-pentofuranosid-2-ulose 2-reductase